MISNLLSKIKSLLLPGEEIPSSPKGGRIAPRQRVLNKLKEQFLTEMANETTTESLLYHTSYTVYIREAEYDRLSPSFAQTVRDAINVFVRELRKVVKAYPDYRNHSNYWEIQLVAIPRDAEVDGISADTIDDELVLIKSKLFADNEYDSRFQDDERCVVTLHTKDSSKQLPNAFNLAALKGLTELAKDKYRVEFNLDDTVAESPKSEADRATTTRSASQSTVASLNIVDGEFIHGDKKYRLYNMTGDRLLVSGKNSASVRGVDEIHINDIDVLCPTLDITRNPPTGAFSIKVWGDVLISERRVDPGVEVPLANNAQIMINGDYIINFKIK